MPTPPQQDAQLIANVLGKIKVRLELIKSLPIPPMTYVLGWADNRYVGAPDDRGEPQIVGFEHAVFFDGHAAAALDWLRDGRRDGIRDAPQTMNAMVAQRQSVDELERAIAFLEAGKD